MYCFSYPHRMISLHQNKTSVSNCKKFCFRCYAYDDHLTINCTKPRDYKVCSEPSSSNHNWRNCQTLTKNCINCSGVHKTLSNQCPRVKMIHQQQSKINRSVPSSAPTPLNHLSTLSHVNLDSKTSFVNVVKKTVQDHQITRDDAFKGLMDIIYSSLVFYGSADIFLNFLDHLLQINKMPSFSIGDCPPLSPLGISTTTPTPHYESNSTPLPGNSETHAGVKPCCLVNL